MQKNKKIVIVIIALILVLGGFVGYTIYKNNVEVTSEEEQPTTATDVIVDGNGKAQINNTELNGESVKTQEALLFFQDQILQNFNIENLQDGEMMAAVKKDQEENFLNGDIVNSIQNLYTGYTKIECSDFKAYHVTKGTYTDNATGKETPSYSVECSFTVVRHLKNGDTVTSTCGTEEEPIQGIVVDTQDGFKYGNFNKK